MQRHGIHVISPVTAQAGGRASGKPRVERQQRIEAVTVLRPDGSTATLQIYAVRGAAHLAETDVTGQVVLVPLKRRATRRTANGDGTYRWYNDYEIPASSGGGHCSIRLLANEQDRKAKLNRTEHLRAIPPTDPDYERIYPRRSDAESQNRALDDSLWLRRAHSVGARRQLLD